jgi:hypothetical protein
MPVVAERPFFRYPYLLGAMPQLQLAMTVRLTCVQEGYTPVTCDHGCMATSLCAYDAAGD